jgi:hypothetical protein
MQKNRDAEERVKGGCSGTPIVAKLPVPFRGTISLNSACWLRGYLLASKARQSVEGGGVEDVCGGQGGVSTRQPLGQECVSKASSGSWPTTPPSTLCHAPALNGRFGSALALEARSGPALVARPQMFDKPAFKQNCATQKLFGLRRLICCIAHKHRLHGEARRPASLTKKLKG